MKQVLIAAFAVVVGMGMVVPDAEAKRLGGGTSSGMKRSIEPSKPAPSQGTTTATPQKPAGATPAPATGMSRFMGPIAGLAAGLGIAALLSHFGLGAEAANFVMILLLILAAVFVFRLLFKRREPQSQLRYAGVDNAAVRQQFEAQSASGGAVAPDDFDTAGFVRQAKLNFVRLQAANDAGDMEDIRNFTTPEMFAEIQMQYQERGRQNQQTDVVQLDAELLDVSEQGANTVASVRFHGLIRETEGAMPEAFDEVWHLIRPLDNSKGWVIAGIQQR